MEGPVSFESQTSVPTPYCQVYAWAYLLRGAFGLGQNQIHSHPAMIESQLMKTIN
jgi:hypothetical protein